MVEIGSEAFNGCALESVTLPDTVARIGANPFVGCKQLSTIRVSPNHPTLAVIDNVLFSKADKRLLCCPAGLGLTSYAIPQGVQAVGSRAFSLCNSLVSIDIPDTVTTIEPWAFSACKGLESIAIPENVKSIGERGFYFCQSLQNVSIPASVTAIGEEAFLKCGDSLVITVPRDSVAADYCESHGLYYTYPDANDWLNG